MENKCACVYNVKLLTEQTDKVDNDWCSQIWPEWLDTYVFKTDVTMAPFSELKEYTIRKTALKNLKRFVWILIFS